MSDVLGVMESWSDAVTVVRTERGETVVVAVPDIVSGKPVPPRPAARRRTG